MNADRRKQLEGIRSDLVDLKMTVEGLKDEEQEYYDNMPESFQNGEKGEEAQTAIDALESAWQSIEEAENQIEEAMNA